MDCAWPVATDLELEYTSPENCRKSLDSKSWNDIKASVERKSTDNPNGKLYLYKQINLSLSPLNIYDENILETDRLIITKYRTGCHYLKVETGRWTRIPHNERLCSCGIEIQDLSHVILQCEKLTSYRTFNVNDLYSFFHLPTNTIVKVLMHAEKELHLHI